MGNVLTEKREALLIVTLNRPAVRNAIDGPTAAELVRVFREFDEDEALSVAVLTGADGVFCAGADLTSLTEGERALHVAEEGDAPLRAQPRARYDPHGSRRLGPGGVEHGARQSHRAAW